MLGAQSIHVGIAEIATSDTKEMQLVAANLGSCLGVTVYDHQQGWGGMVHCLLPLSKKDPKKARTQPCMYVDTGVAELLNRLLRMGSKKEDLSIKVVGGASINDEKNVFEIGKKNFTVLRKILWKNGLLIEAADVGGNNSRTMSLSIADGSVSVKTNGKEFKLGESNGV